MPPAVGVVLIGRNEGGRLVRCLRSIRTEPGFAIYVDSGSTDGSVATARRHGAAVVELDMSQPFTAARARNAGLHALLSARPVTEFVQFVDGDCELDPGWLVVAADFLRSHPEVGGVCGRRREMDPERSVYNRVCDIEWNTPVGQSDACGGDAMFRVAAFATVGGYQEDLKGGEEPELCLRLRQRGWKIWRLDAEMTRHDAAMVHFRQWWLRGTRSGYGLAQLAVAGTEARPAMYRREFGRTIFWGIVLPLAIVVGLAWHPWLGLLAAGLYPLQIARLAMQRIPTEGFSWQYATLMVIGNFPAGLGILRYLYHRWQSQPGELIEYK